MVSEPEERERGTGEGMGDGRGFWGDRHQTKMKSWVRWNCRGFQKTSKCFSAAPFRPLKIHSGSVIPFSGIKSFLLGFSLSVSQLRAATWWPVRKRGLHDDTDDTETLPCFYSPLAMELGVIQQPLGPCSPLSLHNQQQVLPVASLFKSHTQFRKPRFVPAVGLGVVNIVFKLQMLHNYADYYVYILKLVYRLESCAVISLNICSLFLPNSNCDSFPG